MKNSNHMIGVVVVALMAGVAFAGTPFKTYALRIAQKATLDVYEDGKAVTLGRAGKGFVFVGGNPTNGAESVAGCWEADLVPPDDPPGMMWRALLVLRSNGTAEFLEVESTRTITEDNLKTGKIPKWNHRVAILQTGGWEREAGVVKLWLYQE
jgi:hypothetical protein